MPTVIDNWFADVCEGKQTAVAWWSSTKGPFSTAFTRPSESKLRLYHGSKPALEYFCRLNLDGAKIVFHEPSESWAVSAVCPHTDRVAVVRLFSSMQLKSRRLDTSELQALHLRDCQERSSLSPNAF